MSRPLSALVGLAFVVAQPVRCEWSITDFGQRWPGFASSVSLAFDRAGSPAVAVSDYLGAGLYYLEQSGDVWSSSPVSAGCGMESASQVGLVFDAAGRPIVSYYDELSATVRVARRIGGAWTIDVVGAMPGAVTGLSPGIDAAGRFVLAYTGPLLGVRVARLGPGGWSNEVVATGAASLVSLAMDGAGRAAVAYGDGVGLMLARHDGSSWSVAPVLAAASLAAIALAFDGSGRPVIAYSTALDSDLMVASDDGSGWRSESITGGRPTGLALELDPAGALVVAACDGSDRSVRFGRRAGPSWFFETVDERIGSSPRSCSFALDVAGRGAYAYRDSDGSFVLIRDDIATWARQTVPTGLGGLGVAIAIDPADGLVLSHTAGGALWLERRAAGVFASEIVDSGLAGGGTTVGFDAASLPAVSYIKAGELMLARSDGSIWTTELLTLEASSPVLAFDAADAPFIAFARYRGLEVARWTGTRWVFDVIAETATSHAMTRGASGRPIVAWSESGLVQLARWSGLAWEVEVVAAGYPPISVAIDPLGLEAVAYSVIGEGLTIARHTGTAWEPELAGPEAVRRIAISVALAFDGTGQPTVAYVDGARDLQFARSDGSVWRLETVARGIVLPSFEGPPVALTYQRDGTPWIAYRDECGARLATTLRSGLVHRGVVPAFSAGWRASALPLDATNDDETPPFPVPVALPGGRGDGTPLAAALLLYRILRPSGEPIGNVLRARRAPSGRLELTY